MVSKFPTLDVLDKRLKAIVVGLEDGSYVFEKLKDGSIVPILVGGEEEYLPDWNSPILGYEVNSQVA